MCSEYEMIENLKSMNEKDSKEYIQMLFSGYINRKKDKRLFENNNDIPKIIILTYYSCIEKPCFSNVFETFKSKYILDDNAKNFKERYLYNENKLEDVHTKEEKAGLRRVYDYIRDIEDFDSISIYTLSDIHEKLYSLTPYPEFGGRYRNDQKFLPNTGIDLTPPYMIVHEMNLLRTEVEELVKLGIKLGVSNTPELILNYVDRCLDLKCKLIKIHPFGDGNGRSVRAFINLLFKLANIPPVYIENKERIKYGEAMQAAVGDGDADKIKNFYYYKICDSIISLDNHIADNYKICPSENEELKLSRKKSY